MFTHAMEFLLARRQHETNFRGGGSESAHCGCPPGRTPLVRQIFPQFSTPGGGTNYCINWWEIWKTRSDFCRKISTFFLRNLRKIPPFLPPRKSGVFSCFSANFLWLTCCNKKKNFNHHRCDIRRHCSLLNDISARNFFPVQDTKIFTP